jgi:hypothetical protein
MIRAPSARSRARRCPARLRAAIFFSGDNYVKDGERKRTMATATYNTVGDGRIQYLTCATSGRPCPGRQTSRATATV